MTAPVAADATSTSVPHPHSLPLTPSNVVIDNFWKESHTDTLFVNPLSPSTTQNVGLSVANPTDDDGATSSHHDNRQPVDLATLRCEISQTLASFNDWFKTIDPSPTKQASLRTTMTMTAFMDDDNVLHHDATHCHETRQPMDLLAIQREIHQTMASMQLFFDSMRSPPANHHHDCMVAIDGQSNELTNDRTTMA